MKVLVFGSREWVEEKPIHRELSKLPPETIIVHGAQRGADNIAGYVAEKLGFEVRPYPADWDRLKLGAGPVRNAKMLAKEHPDPAGVFFDLALCFHKDPGLGKGSKQMRGLLDEAEPEVELRIFRR